METSGKSRPAATGFSQATPAPHRLRRGPTALAVGYLALQLLIPLRHIAYDGNVLWDEQGMRWAWKVLVREKNGAVTFYVKLPDGRRHIVPPRRYLTDFQEREMSGQPDLILQLAHHIASACTATSPKPRRR